jgi:hypothetical protein
MIRILVEEIRKEIGYNLRNIGLYWTPNWGMSFPALCPTQNLDHVRESEVAV